MALIIKSLGTFGDAEPLFHRMARRHWAVWLDGGQSDSLHSKFDILACDPAITLVTRGTLTEVSGETLYRLSPRDPMELLRNELAKRSQSPIAPTNMPLSGGAIGYFSYDLGRRFEAIAGNTQTGNDLPEMSVGLYDWVVVWDRTSGGASLVAQSDLDGVEERIGYWYERLTGEASVEEASLEYDVVQEPLPDLSFDEYAVAFDKVRHYLEEGDCYQVNLAQRFTAKIEGSPWGLYQQLRRINSAPFSAYLNYPWGQVLSASPERFLSVRSGVVETKPIKGTRARSDNAQEDQRLADELSQSPKDRAENVMIVDLLRNDLGRSCEFGSVKVPKLFEVESFATVHHLVSTVTGRLKEKYDALHLLLGCFPGGSITGAPKVRAMEIIEELEPQRRGIYCGSIGYLGYNGDMDTNIVIRTLLHQEGEVSYWAGGGLVFDSTLEEEYQETLDKAYALQRILQKHVN